jgi:hypothetical protein
MIAQAFGVRTSEPSIEESKLTTRLRPRVNAYLLHSVDGLHPYLPPASRSHEIHLELRIHIIPIDSEPTVLFHRDSHVEMTIISFKSAVTPMLNLQDSLVLCPLLDVDLLLDLLNNVTGTHASPTFIFKTPSRTSLASHLFSPHSIIYLRLATT